MIGKIIKAEMLKLKRYSIVWSGIVMISLSVLLTWFTSTANDSVLWDFEYFVNSVIMINCTMIFPATITLIAGYIITREQTDDTLKNILVIPITFREVLIGKLLTIALLTVLLSLTSFLFVIVVNTIANFPGMTFSLAIKAMIQIIIMNFCLYIAVMPVIILTSHSQNIFLAGVIFTFFYGYIGTFASIHELLVNLYPTTAGLGIIQYNTPSALYNTSYCFFVILFMLIISAFLIMFTGNHVNKLKPIKKNKAKTYKKGW
ncbi:ABC transporter permease [Clostridioides difficile]